ncbi:hypothetical protein DY245_19425 [Streptomyces inhibens]|uniref:Uncharacterized protein n=1 Tax=Streptomyces inhibens TaxID=2293571 RepID=A0A371Q297_STRIH|nr:hypothetical protein [Streptomyces inhibens]REK88836.1 hypothetical protein DY245_19425 [Streptomyces inhibens]
MTNPQYGPAYTPGHPFVAPGAPGTPVAPGMPLAPVAPVAPKKPGHTFAIVVAALLWAITGLALALLAVVFAMVGVWGLASGYSGTELLRDVLKLGFWAVLVIAGLVSLLYVPGFRRLPLPHRLAVLGALACPLPCFYAFLLYSG